MVRRPATAAPHSCAWKRAGELTILPGRMAMIRDAAAYGANCLQGYGRLGPHAVPAPSLIRFGQGTEDEFSVTADAAQAGVALTHLSAYEPLVLLKHFNPGNPEMPVRGG